MCFVSKKMMCLESVQNCCASGSQNSETYDGGNVLTVN